MAIHRVASITWLIQDNDHTMTSQHSASSTRTVNITGWVHLFFVHLHPLYCENAAYDISS